MRRIVFFHQILFLFIFPVFVLAESAQFRSGERVKVLISEYKEPPAEFVAFGKVEKTAKPETCLDASGKRAFAENPLPFTAQWKQEGTCAQGIADATWIFSRLQDASAAQNSIDTLYKAILDSQLELENLTPGSGFTLVALPRGDFEEKVVPKIQQVAMQCVSSKMFSVGVSKSVSVSIYSPVTSAQAKQLAATKKDMESLFNALAAPISKGESYGYVATLYYANKIKGIVNDLKAGFALITPSAQQKYFPALTPDQYITFSMTPTPSVSCAFPDMGKILSQFDIILEGTALDTISVTLDGHLIPRLCAPLRVTADGMKDAVKKVGYTVHTMSSNVDYFFYETSNRKSLKTLDDRKYDCKPGDIASPASSVGADGTLPVRKSTVTPADRRATSDTTLEQSPIPPPQSVEDITDESIFDIVSVDLKVNSSDGPVEIAKGDHISVSWISEGASRCRAMWSKNDIAKSGTVAGRLSKAGSFSIRAACVDADGNRADDAVVVNVR